MSAQPRQPIGSPAGGQFAEMFRLEPEVDLAAGVDLWDDDGTFDAPPHPKDAAHLVRFWMNVPIKDEVLLSARAAFAADQRRRLNDLAIEWEAAERRNLKPYDDGTDAAKRRLREWYKRRDDYLNTEGPNKLEGITVTLTAEMLRPVVRVAKMWQQARLLGPDERKLVWNMPIRLPGGAQSTVGGLVTRYQTSRYVHKIHDKAAMAAIGHAVQENV